VTGENVKIISGGQTGVDRAALDAAIELGLDYGGSVPKGRKAEDGPIDEKYGKLTELGSLSYRVRTQRNVADSDATLIIIRGGFSGGTALTARRASTRHKPCLIVDLKKMDEARALGKATAWLNLVRPGTLNVAGPRESEVPGIYGTAYRFLRLLLISLNTRPGFPPLADDDPMRTA
jgi:hypothetical protein